LSRRLNVASALLVIIGILLLFEGLMALFLPEATLGDWISGTNEELRPPTVSEIRGLGQNLLDYITYKTQWFGLVILFFSLLWIVISLIPYRKGEKWAWYAMLVIGGFTVFGSFVLSYIGETSQAPVFLIFVILWIVALALPAKEILGKPS